MASLGLVAYGSSDESDDSDNEDTHETVDKDGDEKPTTEQHVNSVTQYSDPTSTISNATTDKLEPHFSDDDEDYISNDNSKLVSSTLSNSRLQLPPPSTGQIASSFSSGASGSVPRGSVTPQSPLTELQLEDDIVKSSSSTILSGLPQPKSDGLKQFTFDDELEEEVKAKSYEKDLPKPPVKAKKHQPVKISVPSLQSIDSDDEDSEPLKKRPNRTTGNLTLFSMLPEPKNIIKKEVNRPLLPYTLKKRPVQGTSKKTPQLISSNKTLITTPSNKLNQYVPSQVTAEDSDDDDDDNSTVNFFDIGSKATPNLAPVRIDSGPFVSSGSEFMEEEKPGATIVAGPSVSGDSTVTSMEFSESESFPGPVPLPDANDYEEPYGGEIQQYLHDDEFLKIQGKKHRGKEEIHIIDVNADDQVDKMDLMKTLTEEQQMTSHSRKRKDLPTSQQRRKHQITYLAFQARERELELKNQWAENKQTRKQTQSKYGF